MTKDLAKALNVCLDALARRETIEDCLARYPKQRNELEPLLRTAAVVAAGEPVFAPPEAHEAGRVRLMNRLAAREASHALPRHRGLFDRWPALAGAATSVAAMVLAGGAVVASANALPDEPLYPVKEAIEGAQLMFVASDSDRAALHLEFAGRRLAEEAALAERGRGQAAMRAGDAYGRELARTLDAIQHEQEAGKPVDVLIDQFTQRVERHQTTMTGVLQRVPPAAQSAIERAMDLSQRGQQRAKQIEEQRSRPVESSSPPATTPALSPAQPTATATPVPKEGPAKGDSRGRSDIVPGDGQGREKAPPAKR